MGGYVHSIGSRVTWRYTLYLLDECIALWRVHGEDNGIQCMVWWQIQRYSVASSTLKESSLHLLNIQSLWRTPSKNLLCFKLPCAGVCGFRSALGSHSLSWESTARFHVCRPFNWPSLASSWRHLWETCFCDRQRAGCMPGSVASSTIAWGSRVSLQRSRWRGAVFNKVAVFLVAFSPAHPRSNPPNVVSAVARRLNYVASSTNTWGSRLNFGRL